MKDKRRSSKSTSARPRIAELARRLGTRASPAKATILTVALLGLFSASSPGGPNDWEEQLAQGIRQTRVGDFESAVSTLNEVAAVLKHEGGQARALARAYAYLAICYLGMNHEQTAKAKLVEALEADQDLDVTTAEFPPRIVDLFHEVARAEGTKGSAPEATPEPAASPLPAPPATGKARSKGLLIAGGVVAAGGGVALALGGSGASTAGPATTAADPCRGGFRFEVDYAFSGSISCDTTNPRRQAYRVTNDTDAPLRVDGLDARINYGCEPPGAPTINESLAILVITVPAHSTATLRVGSAEGRGGVACCPTPGTCSAVQCIITEEYTLRTGCGSQVQTQVFQESANGTGGPGDCLACGLTERWY